MTLLYSPLPRNDHTAMQPIMMDVLAMKEMMPMVRRLRISTKTMKNRTGDTTSNLRSGTSFPRVRVHESVMLEKGILPVVASDVVGVLLTVVDSVVADVLKAVEVVEIFAGDVTLGDSVVASSESSETVEREAKDPADRTRSVVVFSPPRYTMKLSIVDRVEFCVHCLTPSSWLRSCSILL